MFWYILCRKKRALSSQRVENIYSVREGRSIPMHLVGLDQEDIFLEHPSPRASWTRRGQFQPVVAMVLPPVATVIHVACGSGKLLGG